MKNMRNTADRKALRSDIEQALKTVAEKHGLTVTVGGGSYSEHTFAPKMEFSCTIDSGAPADFAFDAELVGIPVDCYGKTFTVRGGEQYTIVGINLRARKYPVLAKSNSGTYKFPADTIARLLA